MFYREIMAVCSEIHKRCVDRTWNVQLLVMNTVQDWYVAVLMTQYWRYSNSPLSLQLQKLYFQWYWVRNSATIAPHYAVRKTEAMYLLSAPVFSGSSQNGMNATAVKLSCWTHLLSWPELCSSVERFSESILRDVTHVSFLIPVIHYLLAPSPLSEGRAVSAVEVRSVAVMTISRTDWCHLPTDLLASLNEHK
jgi:hypothetical protein